MKVNSDIGCSINGGYLYYLCLLLLKALIFQKQLTSKEINKCRTQIHQTCAFPLTIKHRKSLVTIFVSFAYVATLPSGTRVDRAGWTTTVWFHFFPTIVIGVLTNLLPTIATGKRLIVCQGIAQLSTPPPISSTLSVFISFSFYGSADHLSVNGAMENLIF